MIKYVSLMLPLFILGALILGCANAPTPPPQETQKTNLPIITNSNTPRPSFRIVGYAPDWDTVVEQIQFDKLTHLNYAFALPQADGTWQEVEHSDKLQAIVQQAHQQNVKVLISVGGWGLDEAFEQLAAAPTTRAKFVSETLKFIGQYQLDGVDIDWEYPGPTASSSQNFTTLMTELRAALPRDKLLTAAVVAVESEGEPISPKVFETVNFLNLMVYDGPDAHHSTIESAQESLAYWHGRGLPTQKSVLGVPFYSRPSEITYRQLVEANPDAAYHDEFNYLNKLESYNGLPTIRLKTQLAQQQASGIMIWALSHDATGELSLLQAIYDTAHQAKDPQKN